MAAVKEEKAMPAKIRGLDISELSTEKNEQLKLEKRLRFIKLNKLTLLGIVFYLLFFGSLSFILKPAQNFLTSGGYCIQLIICALLIKALYTTGNFIQSKLPLLQNQALFNMLQIYAFINIIVAFIILNNLNFSIFKIAG